MSKYWEQSEKLKLADTEIEKLIDSDIISDDDYKTIKSLIHIQRTLRKVSALLEDTDKAINQTVNLFGKLQG